MKRLRERLLALIERVDALSERLTRVEQGLVDHRWEHAQNETSATSEQPEGRSVDELDLVRLGAEADQWRTECEAALERYEEMRDAYLLMAARAGRLQGELLAVEADTAARGVGSARAKASSQAADEAGEPLRPGEVKGARGLQPELQGVPGERDLRRAEVRTLWDDPSCPDGHEMVATERGGAVTLCRRCGAWFRVLEKGHDRLPPVPLLVREIDRLRELLS